MKVAARNLEYTINLEYNSCHIFSGYIRGAVEGLRLDIYKTHGHNHPNGFPIFLAFKDSDKLLFEIKFDKLINGIYTSFIEFDKENVTLRSGSPYLKPDLWNALWFTFLEGEIVIGKGRKYSFNKHFIVKTNVTLSMNNIVFGTEEKNTEYKVKILDEGLYSQKNS